MNESVRHLMNPIAVVNGLDERCSALTSTSGFGERCSPSNEPNCFGERCSPLDEPNCLGERCSPFHSNFVGERCSPLVAHQCLGGRCSPLISTSRFGERCSPLDETHWNTSKKPLLNAIVKATQARIRVSPKSVPNQSKIDPNSVRRRPLWVHEPPWGPIGRQPGQVNLLAWAGKSAGLGG